MLRFIDSLKMWNTPLFVDILQEEIEQLSVDELQLQKALSYGSYASAENVKLIILSISETEKFISARVGVFFTSLIAGCQCADDPSTTTEQSEYCELKFSIDKETANVIIEQCD